MSRAGRSSSALAGALLAAALPLAAQLSGPEFRVNTVTTNWQGAPRAAMDADGGLVVIWSEEAVSPAYYIRARQFPSSGAPVDDIPVTAGAFTRPSVAVRSIGEFVVVWPDASTGSLMGQRLANVPAAPVGSPFTISSSESPRSPEATVDNQGNLVVIWETYPNRIITGRRYRYEGNQFYPLTDPFRVDAGSSMGSPSVATASDGAFVVVWRGLAGSSESIVGRRFAPSGAPRGEPFRVSYQTFDRDPGVASDAAGNFVVVWPSGIGSLFVVLGQRYSSSGATLGDLFRVNTVDGTSDLNPSVARNSNGFLVVSDSNGLDGSGFGVGAQLFDASGRPVGSRFLVGEYTTAYQHFPRAAASTSGGFSVFWQSDGQDGSMYGAFGRRVEMPPPTLGQEFRVNTLTSSPQNGARIAQDTAGNFLVAWSEYAVAANGTDVAAQLLTRDGAPIGGEFRVNEVTAGSQRWPHVAAPATGGFVVVWEGDTDGDSRGIYSRRVSSAGALLGAETRVNTYTTGAQVGPLVAEDSSGGFVVAWISPHGGSGQEVYAQRFSSAWSPVGTELHVNTTTAGPQYLTAIAPGATGFVVTWQAADGIGWGAFAQRFDGSLNALGAEFRANLGTNGDQYGGTAAMDPSGGFVIAWTSPILDGAGLGVVARRFSSGGVPLTGDFVVNSYRAGDQRLPDASADSSGNVLITWGTRDGAGSGVSGQLFASSGAPKGGEFRVNTYTTSNQAYPRTAFDKDVMVVWSSFTQDGSNFGIYGRRFRLCRSSDQNGDGAINVVDVLYLINNLFAGGPAPACFGDADGNGQLSVGDVLYLINYLFAGGPPPV